VSTTRLEDREFGSDSHRAAPETPSSAPFVVRAEFGAFAGFVDHDLLGGHEAR